MPSPAQPSPDPCRLLFVKLKHIGDALLMTPTLTAVRENYPNTEIWVVVRQGTEGILAGCPAIDCLLTVTPIGSTSRGLGSFWRDLRTWFHLYRQQFDFAFELTDGDRGRWFAGTTRARQRCVNVSTHRLNLWWRLWFNRQSKIPWLEKHRVAKDYHTVTDFLPLKGEIPPLSFATPNIPMPKVARHLDDFVVIHPGTRWARKRWPKEYWVQLGHILLRRGHGIILSSGPDNRERNFAHQLLSRWDSCKYAFSTDGKWSWEELASCLSNARAFIGVDTAAMHLAAACQCPVVAIFAHSFACQWRPWKSPHVLLDYAGRWDETDENHLRTKAAKIMKNHTPDKVLAAVDRILRPTQRK